MNAGKYNKKISIYRVVKSEDSAGFVTETTEIILTPYASVKTTKGFIVILRRHIPILLYDILKLL